MRNRKTSVFLCAFHEAAAGRYFLPLVSRSEGQSIESHFSIPNVKPYHAWHDDNIKVYANAAASSGEFVKDHFNTSMGRFCREGHWASATKETGEKAV